MIQNVIICDDSSFARKQMARALPDQLNAQIEFANHGAEAMELLNSGFGDILFLDLNMPVMDGYDTLEAIDRGDYDVTIIVVSGDIQPEAKARVQALGAIEFIKKPIDKPALIEILIELQIIDPVLDETDEGGSEKEKTSAKPIEEQLLKDGVQKDLSLIDTYQEVANVAMGQAADLLARLLDVFVVLPIPKVNELEYSELQMLLTDTARDENVSVICQGFIGFGIAGEALLLFNDSSVDDIAQLMRYDKKSGDTFELELLMDISSILIGACLNGIAQQLDIQFSQGHPVVLGQHVNVKDLLKSEQQPWNKTLAIEINYAIEGRNINCDLLILFTEDSLPDLAKRASYLLES